MIFSDVALSRECSTSSIGLILYRRTKRYVVDLVGRVLWTIFGYRLDISFPSILAAIGVSDTTILPPATRKLFQTLSTCWNEDPLLTLSGRILLKEYYCEIFHMRMRLKAVLEKHPEILEIQIRKPLFIVGWPRVGSTFLHKLLSCDPQSKGPPLWQVMNPIPEEWEKGVDKDVQIERTQKMMDFYFDLEPQLYMLHEMNAKNPDECCHLLEQSWMDRHSPIISENMEQYLTCLKELSMDEQKEIYQFYKESLQVLSFLNEDSPASHHVLKDATHYFFLPGLVETFPDASILMIQRKPSSVARSCLSGIGLVANYYYHPNDISYRSLAARTLQWMSLSVEKSETAMAHHQSLCTVQFEDIIENPIAAVKRIYAHFGYEYTSHFEERMLLYLEEYRTFRAQKKPFRHRLAPFGRSEQEIDDLFA